MLVTLSKKKKPFTWKFSAQDHGKEMVDGFGGTLKSLVSCYTLSKNGGTNVVDAKSFIQLASKLTANINVVYILEERI